MTHLQFRHWFRWLIILQKNMLKHLTTLLSLLNMIDFRAPILTIFWIQFHLCPIVWKRCQRGVFGIENIESNSRETRNLACWTTNVWRGRLVIIILNRFNYLYLLFTIYCLSTVLTLTCLYLIGYWNWEIYLEPKSRRSKGLRRECRDKLG